MSAASGLIAGILALGGIAEWSRRVAAVRVPRDRSAFVAVMTLSLSLGVAALTLSLTIEDFHQLENRPKLTRGLNLVGAAAVCSAVVVYLGWFALVTFHRLG